MKNCNILNLLLTEDAAAEQPQPIATNKEGIQSPSLSRVHKRKDGSFRKRREHLNTILESKPLAKREWNHKPKFSEYCEFVLGKNKLLDRKLEKELRYFQSEMKSNCRLMMEKQRVLKTRHGRLISNHNPTKRTDYKQSACCEVSEKNGGKKHHSGIT